MYSYNDNVYKTYTEVVKAVKEREGVLIPFKPFDVILKKYNITRVETTKPISVETDEDTDETTVKSLYKSKVAERDQLLKDSDFMVLPDYPISSANRALLYAYRQELRDITDNPKFPYIDLPKLELIGD